MSKIASTSTLPAEYRAWVWRGSASPLDLQLETLPLLLPQAGEVLVRNIAIGLNPVDWKVMGGDLLGWQPGKVPGVDAAGVVAAVGEGVPAALLGQAVAYHQSLHKPGSFAEYTPVAAQVLLRLPETLDFATAASFPCPGLTAWQALSKLPERPGQRLLVSGAGGAVGNFLVQLAERRGFEVSVLCNSSHWSRLQALGARDCFADIAALESLSFFAAIDTVNAGHAAQLAPYLDANGHLVCIQGRVESWPCPPFQQVLSIHEVALGALHQFGSAQAWAELTEAGSALLASLGSGHLRAETLVVQDFHTLPQLLEALRLRNFSGKPVVRL
jgi:NADPH2:quinone reductase